VTLLIIFADFQAQHFFAASTESEMHKWINSIQTAIREARVNRKGGSSKRSKSYNGIGKNNNGDDNEKVDVKLSPVILNSALKSATKVDLKGRLDGDFRKEG